MNETCRNIYTIAKREVASYFASPVAYVFIVIFLLLSGFFTFTKGLGFFFERGEASLDGSFFVWHPWLYLFLVPAVGMRLWSEERRMGTMELLLTMPITSWQAIVGKFLASWFFLTVALALTFPVVITVKYLGNPDLGAIFTGYLGSVMLAGGYLAVTSLTSALTRAQVVSFIISVVVCFLLIIAGLEIVTGYLVDRSPALANLVASFSVIPHYINFQRGTLDLRDFVFFFSLISLSLFGTGVILRNLRAG